MTTTSRARILARRLALTGCAAAIAATTTVVAPASADARPLPGGVAPSPVDGTAVKARLDDESVRYVGNVANIPTSQAWVSGRSSPPSGRR